MSGFFDDYYGGGIDDEYPFSQPGGFFKEGGEEEIEKILNEEDEEVEYLEMNISNEENIIDNYDSDAEYTFGGTEIIDVDSSEVEYLDIIEEETKHDDEDVDYVEF